MIEWGKIEAKWRERWEQAHIFEADVDHKRPKYFITVAYPYPNSPQHIGHGRTYTLTDVHARYRRMLGYNVLLPMAFHYTGTPILAISKRLASGDDDLIDTFRRIYKVPEEALATFKDPLSIARYFHEELKQGMKEMGYSIDWRREFTTIDPEYSRFIEWQFKRLHGKGLISQGSHPVGWCPSDEGPVGQHDTLGDVEPEIGEYTLIKFFGEGYCLPAATLRPETIFGATNIWLNPEEDYVKVRVDGEDWVVSPQCARKLLYLNHVVEERGRIKGSELVGALVSNPVTSSRLPVLPASFVDPRNGTGVVYSVPAHAPYDYQALEDLKVSPKELARYGIDQELVRAISPISIIMSEGYPEAPAQEAVRRMGIGSQSDPRLEEATSEVYAHEFHSGVMKENAGAYSGLRVSMAREAVKEDLILSGRAGTLFEIMNQPLVCRCGTECVVKILEDQWFINYGDPSWKALARECLGQMQLLPEDMRPEFEYTVGWLREKACARRSGLGTRLPWDQDWIIESLSDSVIYMAYYTIAKQVKGWGIKHSQLTDEVFDYVFLGLGEADGVASVSGIEADALKAMQREFTYFYPLDSRHSGRDLVPNHLTFFIFHHSAIFPHEYWPVQIVVNGSVLMEGKKMSKSFGNIVPLREAVRNYGADPLRLATLSSAELLQDADFSPSQVRVFSERLERLHEYASNVSKVEEGEGLGMALVDRWLLSTLQRTVKSVTEALNRLRAREAIHHAVFVLDQAVQWYMRRVSNVSDQARRRAIARALREVLDVRVRLLAPFAPFICEEIWGGMGKIGFVALAEWPRADLGMIDTKAEAAEELVRATLEDTLNIIKVTRMRPKKVVYYTASEWKWKAYLGALEAGPGRRPDMRPFMERLLADAEVRERAKELPAFVQKLLGELDSMPSELREARLKLGIIDELEALKDAADFYRQELKDEVEVYSEDDLNKRDPMKRAGLARPYRPAIYLER